jgi:hypothetical protein
VARPSLPIIFGTSFQWSVSTGLNWFEEQLGGKII